MPELLENFQITSKPDGDKVVVTLTATVNQQVLNAAVRDLAPRTTIIDTQYGRVFLVTGRRE